MGYSYKEWSRMIDANQVMHYLEIHEIRRQQRQRPRPAPPSRQQQLQTIRMLLHMSTRLALFEAGAGLSRVWTHVKSGQPFAMISAEKHELNAEENAARTAELVMAVVAAGLGGMQVVGYYQEETDSEPRPETSFFVPYMGTDLAGFRQTILALINQYNQEDALFSDGKEIGDLRRNGDFVERYIDISFDPRLIQKAWSELRKRKFLFFESGLPGTNSGRRLWEEVGLIPDLPLSLLDEARVRQALFVPHRNDTTRLKLT